MTAAAPVVEAVGESLGAEVARRSPLVARALDPEQARDRARAWAARQFPSATVDAVRVRSVRYRPDGSCTLRYQVQLSPPGREHLLLVHVPSSGTGIGVHPFPADPGLPTLARALDPVLMRQVLGRVVPGTGGERAIGRCAVDVVRHPREGRCVLRYRLSPGAGGAGELRHPLVFGKVYDDATAPAEAAAAARLLRAELRRLPDPLRVAVPEPLGVVPALRLGLAEAIAGRPVLPELLKRAAEDGGPDPWLSEAVVAAARTAAAVHGCDPSRSRLPVRDLAALREAAERDLASLETVWPRVAAHLRRSVAGALEAVPEIGPGTGWPPAPVLAHGDLTPGQVLIDPSGRAGLVDVDTLCVAEPALDLGRFLAYLHVAGIRRSPAAWPLLADLSERFLESYLEACPATDARLLRARTAAYRALALARLGASACWQLKDHRLGAAVDVLDAGNEWMGSGTA